MKKQFTKVFLLLLAGIFSSLLYTPKVFASGNTDGQGSTVGAELRKGDPGVYITARDKVNEIGERVKESLGNSGGKGDNPYITTIQTPDGVYSSGPSVLGTTQDKTKTSNITYNTVSNNYAWCYPGTNIPITDSQGRIIQVSVGYSTVDSNGEIDYRAGGIVESQENGYTRSIQGNPVKDIVHAFLEFDPSGGIATAFVQGKLQDGLRMSQERVVCVDGIPSAFAIFNDGITTYVTNPEFKAKYPSRYEKLVQMSGKEPPVFDQYDADIFASVESWADKAATYDAYWKLPSILGLLTQEEINALFLEFGLIPPELPPLEEPPTEEEPEPEDPYSETIPGVPNFNHLSGAAYPTYNTWHEAKSHLAANGEEYELRKGIPSNEMVKNHILVDDWYGLYDWEYQTGKFQYTIKVSASYYYWDWEWEDPDETIGSLVQKVGSKEFEVEVKRPWGFYYSPYIELYHKPEVTIDNPAYSHGSGVIQYGPGPKLGGESIYEEPTLPLWGGHVQEPEWEPTAGCGIYESASAISMADVIAAAENAVGKVKSQNDLLDVDGHLYMNGVLREDYDTTIYEAEDRPNPIEIDHFTDYEDSDSRLIPANTENGKYKTNALFQWRPWDYNKGGVYTKGGVYDEKPTSHILQSESTGWLADQGHEIINVMTPVISPVSIINPNTKPDDTQLVEAKINGGFAWQNLDDMGIDKYYLLLDHEYTFEFDPYKWLSDQYGDLEGYGFSDDAPGNGYNDKIKYDKYVKKKEVRFPFTVALNGSWYDVGSNGYTQWIELKKDDNYRTTFYIPSFAKETSTVYPNGEDYYRIQYRVHATNVVDQFNTDHDTPANERETYNGRQNLEYADEGISADNSSYIATYEIPVDVSGIIYDFQVTGITDSDVFEELDTVNPIHPYSFVLNKEEKRAGTKNRLGGDAVRYTYDGLINMAWSWRNTIALSAGRSQAYSEMGNVRQGNTFGFSIRTIANLAEGDDFIEIKPTLRYVDRNGVEEENIQIYYFTDPTEDGKGNFVQFGTDQDNKYWFNTKLGSKLFEGGYYTNAQYNGSEQKVGQGSGLRKRYDELDYSAIEYYASKPDPVQYYLNHEVKSYNASYIKMYDTMRLLSGNLERLEMNMGTDNIDGYLSLDRYGADYVSKLIDPTTLLRKSMQTWYGEYSIPNRYYVVKEDVLIEKIKDAIGDPGADPDVNGDGKVDLKDYTKATGEGISTDDKIWEKSGFLVLNFNIQTSNVSRGHLNYDGGYSMWEREGRQTTVTTGNAEGNVTIHTRRGDVAIISLRDSVQDAYAGRILFIN